MPKKIKKIIKVQFADIQRKSRLSRWLAIARIAPRRLKVNWIQKSEAFSG